MKKKKVREERGRMVEALKAVLEGQAARLDLNLAIGGKPLIASIYRMHSGSLLARIDCKRPEI